MSSGVNGANPGLSRNGQGAQRSSSSSSSSGGAIPKVKLRKKIPSQPNSLPHPQLPNLQLSHPPMPHQVDPQAMSHQLMALMYQHSSTNGHFQNTSNLSPTNSTGLPQPVVCKNIPKNQLFFDWQSGEIQSSSQGNCRNRPTSSELYDSASDESVSQDNCRGVPAEINKTADSQTIYRCHRLKMNGQEASKRESPLSQSEVSTHNMALNNGASCDRPNRNVDNHLPVVDAKKINVTSSPDRAQVERRLSQIQDYIKQTSALIESYRLPGVQQGATDDSSLEFLVEVLKDLQDSEAKLKCLLAAFDQITAEDDVKNNTEAVGVEMTSRPPLPQEPQVNGNDHSSIAKPIAPKMTDTRKQNEMKMKFEESLKQLHALQAEQNLLILKRNEAQEQIQEAQRARNILLAMSANDCPVNAQGDVAASVGSEEQMTEAFLKNMQDVDRHLAFRGRNQASPSQDLSNRKRQPTDSQPDVTTYLKELLTGNEVKEQASSEDSAVEDAMDEYAEAKAQVRLQGHIVKDKVAEINALRAQLDQAKSLLNLAHRRENRSHTSDNSADEALTDQAVDNQRQHQGDGDSAITDQADPRKAKPSVKQQLLELERAKLGRLRGMLATVQEYRSSGLPIPEHILNDFGAEAQSSVSSAPKVEQDEDAAVEADVEEDDEPESAMQWNQQHMSLVESASMASELSQGLQQRAAQLQVERDGLAAMQRQLDGLFNQLQQHQTAEKATDRTNGGASSIADSSQASSPFLHRRRNIEEDKRSGEAQQRRTELVSDLLIRCQQLQDEIASDGELNMKAAPTLSAAKSALNMLTSQILTEAVVADNHAQEPTWDQRSLQDRRQETPPRSERTTHSLSQDCRSYENGQISSAPSTFLRRKSPSDVARSQRAVWSSATVEELPASSNSTSDSLRYSSNHPEENPPIVSMPSPSPSMLHQQTQEMKNRIAALSHSCQSLCMDSVEGILSSPTLPLMPAAAIPPPPPPAPGSLSNDREAYYQQLLAAGQLQQQQVLLTAINQCFHILKLQQHELLNLRSSVHMLSSGASHVTPVHPHAHPSVHPVVNAGVHPGMHPGVHPGVHPGLLQNEEQWATPSPAPGPGPPTLNNQVPPGNRTNNYWDNFRSYSRQNLLSTSAKSNEGLPHSPSPLVERSHNSLRSSTPMSVPGASSMSTMPQFHTLSLLGVTLPQHASLAEAPIGAVGPAPEAASDFSHTSLVQNISRKDKRNIDHADGASGPPRQHPSNEIDHRTASRVLEDAALPLNSQMLSPTSQEFDVPSMPILRNSVASLQSRLNQVNLNAPPSFANLQELIETQSARQQLNNEGVPFSEISTSLSNQQFNEFNGACSLDHTRESSRRLNMDYHNGTTESEPSSSTALKRNTGAIKRTYTTLQSPVSNAAPFTSNYQRNIHSTVSHLSSSNSSSTENSNVTSKLSSVFPMSNSDSETVFRSAKLRSGQVSARNYNCVGRRPGYQEELQAPCSSSSSSSKSRMRGINETDDHSVFHHDHTNETEYESTSLSRSIGFNNCPSSASSQSSSSQNTSNVEMHSLGPGKNHLKESCFQIRKCPKYQSKPESKNPLSDPTAVASTTGSQRSPSQLNVRSTASKSQSSNSQRTGNKNNQDFTVLNQMSGQGQLYEELRESVYAEMTSLISANGNRSHFLVQLLKDLQHISSDSVRQSVLQLIHQAVSRYQIDLTTLSQDGFVFAMEDEAEEDGDESQRLERDRLSYAGACGSSDFKASASSTQEGETLMQLVLGLELAAVLSGSPDEICSPNLIEDVRSRILQLIPMPQTLAVSNTQSSSCTRSASYVHAQIDHVLESVCLKFQGRRVGEVRNEITSCVVSALPIKLMYRSMVDYYSRNNMETEVHSRREGSGAFRENIASPAVNPVSPSPVQYSQHTTPLNHQDAGLLAEASNGDLAEADQSHHSINTADDDEDPAEGPLSASGLLHVHMYQMNGASEAVDCQPEVEALQEEGDDMACAIEKSACRNDVAGAVGGTGVTMVERNTVDDGNELWGLDRDEDDLEKGRERERGLDQVPTRLACDSDRDQENGEKLSSHHLAMPSNESS